MEKFIEKITKEAGKIVIGLYKNVKPREKTGRQDLVTEADHKANRYFIDTIKKNFPEHGIISEEMDDEKTDAEFVWVIDPIDGTYNYAKGIPLFSIAVSFTRRLVPQFSAIYDPVNGEFLIAKAGKGVYLNGKKVHCAKVRKLEDSRGNFCSCVGPKYNQYWNSLLRLGKEKNIFISIFGSAAKAAHSVAIGARDWHVSFDEYLWDLIPEIHVLKESGCKVTNLKGKPWKPGDKGYIAANKYLHKQLLKVFSK